MRLASSFAAFTAAILVAGCSADTSQDSTPLPTPTSDAAPVEQTTEMVVEGEVVTLEVGHCYVDPVRADGQSWVTRRTLVGGGGGLPRDFTPRGVFVVESATQAKFVADGGGVIPFKPAPSRIPARPCR